jgi:DNA-binding transcriptional MerR regulator
MAGLTIGKFAAAAGVGVETVRFYQRRGLLARPERGGSGFREYTEYTEDDRWRLAFIRGAQQLGFTLGEIRDLLGPAQARSTEEIAAAAEAKLTGVAEQMRNWPGCSAGCAAWSRCVSTAAATTASRCTSASRSPPITREGN